MTKKDLWLKIKLYHFDDVVPPHLWHHITQVFGRMDASTKAFAGKVARKSGWTTEFALKAIVEYKKFVYLGVVSNFNVTPSKIIDQVWHEHLLFTKAYRKFCTEIIEYSFDHNPELIPMTDQTGTFNVQYIETISFYKTEFGINPPADIWSVPKFDQITAALYGYELNKNKNKSANPFSEATLVSYFEVPEHGGSLQSLPEFGGFGGGMSGGGGADGGWGNQHSNPDSGNSVGGVSAGDAGGDGGSSGCSSGCGGGGD